MFKKGYKMSRCHRDNISKALMGRVPWNKGKKGAQIAWNKGKKGSTPWNKGKHPDYMQGKNHPMWGKKHSKKSKDKISFTKKGCISPRKGVKLLEETKEKLRKANIGKKYSEETKQKLREFHINNPNRKFKDTKIELKMEEALKRRHINYQKQVPISNIAIVDFYLPDYKIIIQCDGCYWHGCKIHKPNGKDTHKKDIEKDKKIKLKGYAIYRFWEHEINESVEKCLEKLLNNK